MCSYFRMVLKHAALVKPLHIVYLEKISPRVSPTLTLSVNRDPHLI